jgi:hypothetical protein
LKIPNLASKRPVYIRRNIQQLRHFLDFHGAIPLVTKQVGQILRDIFHRDSLPSLPGTVFREAGLPGLSTNANDIRIPGSTRCVSVPRADRSPESWHSRMS